LAVLLYEIVFSRSVLLYIQPTLFFNPVMQIFALTPHFWTCSHVTTSTRRWTGYFKLRRPKIILPPSRLQYILFQKKISRPARFTLFTTDPSHFQPVLLYERPEVGVIFGLQVVTGAFAAMEDKWCKKTVSHCNDCMSAF
jgi:hypothetical protein